MWVRGATHRSLFKIIIWHSFAFLLLFYNLFISLFFWPSTFSVTHVRTVRTGSYALAGCICLQSYAKKFHVNQTNNSWFLNLQSYSHFDVLFYFVRGSWGRRVDYQRGSREVSVRQREKSLENFTQGRSWSGWKNLERNQFPRKRYERKHGLCGKIWLDFFNATWKWNTIQGKGSSWLNITYSSKKIVNCN